MEQLQEVAQPIAPLPFTQRFDLALLDRALAQLQEVQTVGKLTGCTHAAAWIQPDGALSGGCEDVGRHVALDKLLGYRSQQAWLQGAALVSSRASYEMVQNPPCAASRSCSPFPPPPAWRWKWPNAAT